MSRLARHELPELVPGAKRLFEELGTLDRVGLLVTAWFTQHLEKSPAQ